MNRRPGVGSWHQTLKGWAQSRKVDANNRALAVPGRHCGPAHYDCHQEVGSSAEQSFSCPR
eukprot:353278-Hanusia_phi.AAC.1